MRLAVLVSGRGSNLAAVLDAVADGRLPQVEPVLARICARQRIDFIHSISRLRDAAQHPDAADKPIYYMQDGHWNAAGHAVVAEMLRYYLFDVIE